MIRIMITLRTTNYNNNRRVYTVVIILYMQVYCGFQIDQREAIIIDDNNIGRRTGETKWTLPQALGYETGTSEHTYL